jgi:hypothetical protein
MDGQDGDRMNAGMPREKDHKIRIDPVVDMLRMDQPLFYFNKLIGPVLLLP